MSDQWVCELCFRTIRADRLPDDWELVHQSAVCPDCIRRARANDVSLAECCGGVYSDGRPDSRNKGIKYHRVVTDTAGWGKHTRLTCMDPECEGATLVRQPWMSDRLWSDNLREFRVKHPCRDEDMEVLS